MLFKKKVRVRDYCVASLEAVFAKDREITWEALRRSCNDRGLTDADAEIYHTHLRAIFIQLMLVGIAKNCNMNTSSDAHVLVLIWLKERGQPEIQEVVSGYSQAFGGAMSDGVMEMVMHFAGCVASSELRQDTIERLHVEFYGMLKLFFDDFKSIKLVSIK
jgi:hypothetical protein